MPPGLPALFPCLLVSLGLAACGEGGSGTSFQLTLRPVPPPSQPNLFDDVELLVVNVVDAAGAVESYDLEVERGTAPSIDGLGMLPEGAVIELEGYGGTGPQAPLVAWGRSEPLDVGRAEVIEVEIFVGAVGEMATFNALDAGSWGAAVVSDGEGRFFVFGGTDDDWTDAAVDAISTWDLVPPDPEFEPALHATFPVTSDSWPGYTNTITGRLHHTATLLAEGNHADVGKIMVAGGWSTLQGSRTVTSQIFLYDPTAEPDQAVEELDGLKTGRALHQAVPLTSGDVVFFGGYNYTDRDGTIGCPETVEVYQAAERESVYGFPSVGECMVDGAAAPLGDNALHCGGVLWASNDTSEALADCVKVDRYANVTPVDGPTGLSGAGLLLPSMAALDGNAVLLTGGVELAGEVDDDTWLDASSRAFLYSGDANSWQEVARMKVPRAGHVSSLLPDGRVLVAGGTAQLRNRGFDFEDELPCAEVYNPDDNSWTLLDSTCAAGSAVGSLPTGLFRPSIAVDPNYGVLIWGGIQESMSGQPKAQPYYALYVTGPE